MSQAPRKRFTPHRWLIRLSLAGVILLGLLMASARLLLPSLAQYQAEIERWAGSELGGQVSIGRLTTDWEGVNPVIRLQQVSVQGLSANGQDETEVIGLESLDIVVDTLGSLLRLDWQIDAVMLRMHRLHIMRNEDGRINLQLAGQTQAEEETLDRPLLEWIFDQPDLFVMIDKLYLEDRQRQLPTLQLQSLGVSFVNEENSHKLSVDTSADPQVARRLRAVIELTSERLTRESLDARIYVRLEQGQLGPWQQLLAGYVSPSDTGAVDAEIWADVAGSRLQRLQGHLAVSDLALRPVSAGAPPYRLDRFATDFLWQTEQAGWQLQLGQLQVQRGDRVWPASQIRVHKQIGDEERRYLINADFLRIEDILPVVANQPSLPPRAQHILHALAPRGELGKLRLEVAYDSSRLTAYGLQAELADVAINARKDMPGFSGIAGTVYATEQAGMLSLHSERSAIDLASLFRDPIELERFSGDINWSRLDEGWLIESDELVAQNNHLLTQSRLSLMVPNQGAPFVDMQTDFHDGDGSYTSRYLPALIMDEEAVAWLDKGIVSGHVEYGTFILYGSMDDFPFDRQEGRFEVRFKVSDGILDYYEDWPRIDEIEAEVAFVGRGMRIEATAGKIFEADIDRVVVEIPDLESDNPMLRINGHADTSSRDLFHYLQETQLAGDYAGALEELSLQGRHDLELGLAIPLSEGDIQYQGRLDFRQNQLSLPSWGIDIEGIDGGLKFSNRGFFADALSGHFQKRPLKVEVSTVDSPAGRETRIRANARADITRLVAPRSPVLASQMKGVSPVRVEIEIPDDSKRGTRLKLSSSLQGTELKLPAPLGKPAQEARPIMLRTGLSGAQARRVHLSLEDLLLGEIWVSKDGRGLEKAAFYLGDKQGETPQPGELLIAGELMALDIDEWLVWFQQLPDSEAASAQRLDWRLDTQVEHVFFKDWYWHGVGVRSAMLDSYWVTTLSGDDIAGDIVIPLQQSAGADEPAPIRVDLSRLNLRHVETAEEDLARFAEQAAAPADWTPADVPALRVNVAEVQLHDRQLGSLEASLNPATDAVYLDYLRLKNPQSQADLTGQWRFTPDLGHETLVEGRLESEDAGNLLYRLGYADTLAGGTADVRLSLSIPHHPQMWDKKYLNGSMHLSLHDGQILEVDPGGAGRLFGLLSFQALPRRLSLDFSDLFRKGLSFDDIEGNFTFSDGQAYTNDLLLDAPSSRVHVSGRVGLVDEDYDQLVKVTPNVSASLPVAGTLAGGPALGLVMLLTHQLIRKPLDKLAELEYRITGPWHDPQIEKLEVAKKSGSPEASSAPQ